MTWRWIANAAVVVGIMFACFPAYSLAQSAEAGSRGPAIVAPEKVTLTGKDEKAHSATVTVSNPGPVIDVLEFRVVGDKAVEVASTEPLQMEANSVARFPLTFAPTAGTDTAAGLLVVSASGRTPGTVPFALSEQETPDWIAEAIFGALAVALVLVVIGWVAMSSRPNLGNRLGPVDWDISKSWASNLTVFSALLGTILASAALPELSGTDKARYAGLSLLFGLGVLVGPFLYTALETPVKVNRRSTIREPQYQGRVWAFLLATVVMVWAATGQFATMVHLFDEIRKGGALPDGGMVVFSGLVIVAGLSLLLLTWVRMRAILRSQSDDGKTKRKEAEHHRLQAQGVTGIAEDEVVPELESWTMY